MSTYPYPVASVPHYAQLVSTARALVADGKGILAADEDVECLWSRFKPYGIAETPVNRVALRHALFTCDGLETCVGGVILVADTYSHRAPDGRLLVDLLKAKGVHVGITVDAGMPELAGTHGEGVTQGIDAVAERCRTFAAQGATFAKFRAVVKLDAQLGHPSSNAIQLNAVTLARYASLAQEAGLVPIVEPEVSVFDGRNSAEESAKITQEVLSSVFRALVVHNVVLEGIVLKPNMVVAGKQAAHAASLADSAALTLRVLQNTVPASVPAIAFLSGGMTEGDATAVLDGINKLDGPRPWRVTFSFGRALQQSALAAWRGDPANVPALQAAFMARARANHDASLGRWK